MTIWLYVDEFASMMADDEAAARGLSSGQELEYLELEQLFRDAYPAADLHFKRDVLPTELANGAPAVYCWDIGGMCYTDLSGARRERFTRAVLNHIDDHPDTLFVPWSSFTQRYARAVLEDLAGPLPPNVVVIPEGQEYECPSYSTLLMTSIASRLKST